MAILYSSTSNRRFLRAQTQWAPILTSHDPNPPITLEDASVPSVGQPTMARWQGVAHMQVKPRLSFLVGWR